LPIVESRGRDVTDWLTFPEAVVLVQSRLGSTLGFAKSQVREAIASGQVDISYAPAAIAAQEREAYSELLQDASASAEARGLKLSGSALDIMSQRARKGAFARAKARLGLTPKIGESSFDAALASGEITINALDLKNWLGRRGAPPPPAPAPRSTTRRRRPAQDRAEQAIAALWPQGVPSEKQIPNPILLKKVGDWI
jgi:hypothetical protein